MGQQAKQNKKKPDDTERVTWQKNKRGDSKVDQITAL